MTVYGLVMLAVTEFVVTILVFLFAGRWADHHWNADGRYMTLATILGFVLGCVRMYMRLKGVMGPGGNGSEGAGNNDG